MRTFSFVGAAFAGTIAGTVAQFAGSSNGTTAVKFLGLPSSITYQKVQSLDNNGNCPMESYSYSAALAPLLEEYSMILRGPIRVKQLAVYTLDNPAKRKRDSGADAHHKRHGHGHQHFHEHNQQRRELKEPEEKRGVGDEVVVTMGGKVVSWANSYGGAPAPSPQPAVAPAVAPAVKAPAADLTAAMGSVTPTTPAPSATPTVDAGAGNWARQAYYNAADGTATGLTFLANNQYNQDNYMKLGAILGFVTSNGLNNSAESATLEDCLLPDNTEVIVSSDKLCNGDCGATAPGALAHHGWTGGNKAFFAEYTMPSSGAKNPASCATNAFGKCNADMPAFWLLNTQAINTQQYGACSCWKSGCGEFDVHEVLEPGETQGFASLHMGPNYAATAPDGLSRPMSGTMKIAAIITDSHVHVQVLDEGFQFDEKVPGSVIAGFVNHPDAANVQVNLHP